MDIVLLARNYPAGTSELFPLSANSDLRRNFTLRRNCPADVKFRIYVEIVSLELQSDFLFAPTRIYIEIVQYVEIVLLAPRN